MEAVARVVVVVAKEREQNMTVVFKTVDRFVVC